MIKHARKAIRSWRDVAAAILKMDGGASSGENSFLSVDSASATAAAAGRMGASGASREDEASWWSGDGRSEASSLGGRTTAAASSTGAAGPPPPGAPVSLPTCSGSLLLDTVRRVPDEGVNYDGESLTSARSLTKRSAAAKRSVFFF